MKCRKIRQKDKHKERPIQKMKIKIITCEKIQEERQKEIRKKQKGKSYGETMTKKNKY